MLIRRMVELYAWDCESNSTWPNCGENLTKGHILKKQLLNKAWWVLQLEELAFGSIDIWSP